MTLRHASSSRNECKAPDCRAHVLNWSEKFCPKCQEKLDRVKRQLEVTGKDGSGRKNSHSVLPSVASLDPARAASFDAGLTRRAAQGTPLTERDRSIRAVRIIQMKQAKEPVDVILKQLCLADTKELEQELARYQSRQEVASLRKGWGKMRDVSTDKAILVLLKDPSKSRGEMAQELGLTRPALNSRLRRLRREGHDLPDGRGTRHRQPA